MSLSPIGIDIGSYKTVISVSVDVLLNSYSNRSTPSSLTFTQQGIRLFGEDSKNQAIQNFKTTISQFKHLIKFNSLGELDFISAQLIKHNHELGFQLDNEFYGPVQLYSMFLGSLKTQIEENGIKIGKCIISVPGNYTSRERELVHIAGYIAGLKDLDVISESVAAGMTFATKNHESGTDEQKRIIVDVGYSQLSISLLRISERTIIVERSLVDNNIGGRIIDKLLCDNLLQKVGLNFEIHSKPYQRVLKECEKFKKILSANQFVSVNIENVTEDKDINTSIKREEFEEWINEILVRVQHDVSKFLHKKDQFQSVELIGGTSRIPSIKDIISKGFKTELGLTLNQDEAISLGDAYLSAVFTKNLQQSHYKIQDLNLHKIDFFIHKEKFENVFPKNKKIPQQQTLEFNIDNDFTIEARDKHIILGQWRLTGFDKSGPTFVQVQFLLNLQGELELIQADQVEQTTSSKFTSVFGGKDQFQSVNQLKSQIVPLISKSHIHHFIKQEAKLQKIDLADKLNKETKNQLESTIYRTRRKLTNDELQSQYGSILDQLEDWLYEDGDEAPTETYKEKLAYLEQLPL
ncbi:Chaperone protein [Wickerhamomyces ciferrii]|uniref:Chaperone protein n=1 Tax=Wickerhamomyces ciferrii (strain ATCC 14091 / BCRC 22168 / CBS 111 / JCM 3599 / NBRC 0793 / NRRL Y-1031 F-60-10) TaxID=1206466 RepID=K0KSC7_WICCF|nr:Chaperone protein [Wickerhamomyces ciferrii]CCH44234.1 Chaperone protein [Wickerhamomyces ciferrii]